MSLDTKAYVKFEFKGYPHGKTLLCVVWLKGKHNKEDIGYYIKENTTINKTYDDVYELHDYKVVRVSTEIKKDDVGYGILTLNKELDHKPKNKNTKKPPKKTKVNLYKIILEEYDIKDVEYILEYAENVLFMKDYELSYAEYEFYIENRDEIDPEETKKYFKECNGDAFKFKKNKIRSIIYSK